MEKYDDVIEKAREFALKLDIPKFQVGDIVKVLDPSNNIDDIVIGVVTRASESWRSYEVKHFCGCAEESNIWHITEELALLERKKLDIHALAPKAKVTCPHCGHKLEVLDIPSIVDHHTVEYCPDCEHCYMFKRQGYKLVAVSNKYTERYFYT